MLASWTVLVVALLATGAFAQTGSLSLNPGLYDLQWDCSPTDNVIVFNISVQTQGWVGFGISPDGNMPNSDVVVLLPNGSSTDRYTDGRISPLLDNSQDWQLLASGRDGNRRVATYIRALSTADKGTGGNDQPVDLDIGVGTGVNLIYAWRNAADNNFNIHDVRGNALDITLCVEPPSPPEPSSDPPVPTTNEIIKPTSSDDVPVTKSTMPSPPPSSPSPPKPPPPPPPPSSSSPPKPPPPPPPPPSSSPSPPPSPPPPSPPPPSPSPPPPSSSPSPPSPPPPSPPPPPPPSSPSPPPPPPPSPKPNCTNVCINMQTLDPRDCSCSCLIDTYPCPLNEVFNDAICACERSSDCPELVTDTCPPGEVFSLENCTCVPECTLTCDSPKRLDANQCACVCPPSILPRDMECPSPLVFSEETCLCECPLDQSQCGPGQVLNMDDCSCKCPSITSCPPGQSYDQSICECMYSCDKEEVCCEGRVFNMDTCQCECADNTACPQGQSRNSDSCECECAARSSEELWNYESGKCWRDNNKIFNIFSCGCECPKFLTCPRGKRWDSTMCQCVCRPQQHRCSYGQTYSSSSCSCQCTRSCRHYETLDQRTCRCIRRYPSTRPPMTRPPTRPPSTVPPRSCSIYRTQWACKISGYHGLSCRWHQGRCISHDHCCQPSSRRTNNHAYVLHCQSYNEYFCDASHDCRWNC